VTVGIEVGHFRGDGGIEQGRIDQGHAPRTASAAAQPGQKGIHAHTQSRDDAESGDRDPPHGAGQAGGDVRLASTLAQCVDYLADTFHLLNDLIRNIDVELRSSNVNTRSMPSSESMPSS